MSGDPGGGGPVWPSSLHSVQTPVIGKCVFRGSLQNLHTEEHIVLGLFTLGCLLGAMYGSFTNMASFI